MYHEYVCLGVGLETMHTLGLTHIAKLMVIGSKKNTFYGFCAFSNLSHNLFNVWGIIVFLIYLLVYSM